MESDHVVHHVQQGDTLAGLAMRYGVDAHDLRRANLLLDSPDSLRSRAMLKIPIPRKSWFAGASSQTGGGKGGGGHRQSVGFPRDSGWCETEDQEPEFDPWTVDTASGLGESTKAWSEFGTTAPSVSPVISVGGQVALLHEAEQEDSTTGTTDASPVATILRRIDADVTTAYASFRESLKRPAGLSGAPNTSAPHFPNDVEYLGTTDSTFLFSGHPSLAARRRRRVGSANTSSSNIRSILDTVEDPLERPLTNVLSESSLNRVRDPRRRDLNPIEGFEMDMVLGAWDFLEAKVLPVIMESSFLGTGSSSSPGRRATTSVDSESRDREVELRTLPLRGMYAGAPVSREWTALDDQNGSKKDK